MSTFVTIVLEQGGEAEVPEDMNDGDSVYGADAGHAIEELDEIADELGISPLSSFTAEDAESDEDLLAYDSDEEDVDDDDDEDYGEDGERWHDPGPALASVIEIYQYLQDADAAILKRKFRNTFAGEKLDGVLSDLKIFERILEQAEKDKDRFQFKMD